MIYGENLVQVDNDDAEVIFTSSDQNTVENWCKRNEWDYGLVAKSFT